MTTTNMQTTRHKRTAILGWFPSTPAKEREVLDITPARQLALRERLRHHYWLTDCQPFTNATVSKLRRKMALIDPQDTMEDEAVRELLSDHYGFAPATAADGSQAWRIPELDEARGTAVAAIEALSERAREAGLKSAEARRQRQQAGGAQASQDGPSASDREEF